MVMDSSSLLEFINLYDKKMDGIRKEREKKGIFEKND
jgi:hypothetical protein